MATKRRAPLALALGAALATSAGCAGPKFESAAGTGGAEAVHVAGRGATGHQGTPDAASDAGEANGGEGSVGPPASGARDAGTSVHDDGGAPAADTTGGTGGMTAGRANEPSAGSGGSAGSGTAASAGMTDTSGTGGAGRSAGMAGTPGAGATGGSGAIGGAPAAGSGGAPPEGSGGTPAGGTAGTAPSGDGGTNAAGAPGCAPAACPLLPPADGSDCTSCEVPASGCSYDACLLVGTSYFAECVDGRWAVTAQACTASSEECCPEDADEDACKAQGKAKGCHRKD